MTEREFATDVVRRLQQAGFRALWAGGCVRDELLGLSPQDYDIATDARPEQVQALFRRCLAIGASFGVIEVIGPRDPDRGGDHLTVEVATFRSDGAYTDGRRPDTVRFSSPEEDAQRRDFTINGMFFDPIAGALHDFVGGRADLDAKALRAIGNPTERFTEDKLRVLRAVRIAARFGLEIDPATLAAGKQLAPTIVVVSAERIAEEFRKLLTHPNRGRGVRLLREFGLIEPILPELVPTFTLAQSPTGALWEHTVAVVERLAAPTWPQPEPVSFALGLAALLHDVGKPRVARGTPDGGAFPGYEQIGREMTEAIADRLRLSTAEKIRAAWLVGKHQFLTDAPTLRASRLKPILVHPGIGDLLALHRAEALASGRGLDHVEFCEAMLRDTPLEELSPPPAITGEDLIGLGMKPGPDFKRLLDAVREAQLEGRVKSKSDGLRLVEELRAG